MQSVKSNESFEFVTNSDTPVIVKFEARWCPDCRAMDLWIGPIVGQYNDYQWYTANCDELGDTVVENEVMSTPSLLVSKNGDKIAHLRSANAKSPEQVESFLAETFK